MLVACKSDFDLTESANWADSVSVCHVSVPSRKTRFRLDWRLLVKESIPYIGIPLDLKKKNNNKLLRFDFFLDFWVCANQPTLHNGGVSRGCWR